MAPCKRSAAAIDGDMHHHRLDLAAVKVPARRQHGRNRRAQPRRHARGPPRRSTATCITAASTRRPSKSLPDASTATTRALNHGSMPEVRRADRRRHASPPPRPGGRRSSCPPPARPQPARSTTAPCKRSAAPIDRDEHHRRRRPGGRRSSCPPPARPQPARSTTAPCERSAAPIDGDVLRRADRESRRPPFRLHRSERARPHWHKMGTRQKARCHMQFLFCLFSIS